MIAGEAMSRLAAPADDVMNRRRLTVVMMVPPRVFLRRDRAAFCEATVGGK
jgi:hypothetical protein